MIAHIITSLDKGGAEGVLVRLLSIKKSDEKSIVITMKPDGYWAKTLRLNGIMVYELNFFTIRNSLRSIWLCRRLLKRLQPKLIVSWLYHADLLTFIMWLMFVRTPIIWNLRQTNLHPQKSSKITRWIFQINAVASHAVPREIICCANAVKDFHVTQRYCSAKMRVIPNGFNIPDNKQPSKLSTNRFTIGMAARFDGQKDHRLLLNAVSNFKRDVSDKFQLLLAGSQVDEHNTELMRLIKDLKLENQVTLLGQINNMTEFYQRLDLHCLISAFGEGFPNVVAESMAHGIPNIASNSGEAVAILEDSGIVVPINDCVELTNAIAVMFHEWSTGVYSARRQRARTIISDQYSIDRMHTMYDGIFAKYET